MIIGAHTILYSTDAEADRAFLRDVLGLPSVDADHGWLIFALPPAEAAVHPADKNDVHELFLITDDLPGEMARLEKVGVACEPLTEQRWGKAHRAQAARRRQAGALRAAASAGDRSLSAASRALFFTDGTVPFAPPIFPLIGADRKSLIQQPHIIEDDPLRSAPGKLAKNRR